MSGRLIPFRKGPDSQPRPPAVGRGVDPLAALRAAGAAGEGASRAITATGFRDLMAPHIDAAYSLARYLARDASAAEDIAQDALLKAFSRRDTLRGDALRPWLLAIVRNAYFDWRRRADDREVTGPVAEAAFAETPDASQPSPEAALIRRGDVEALRSAIAEIPEPFREALVLREFDDLTYRDIAAVTGAPLGTVMSRLARARRMLAERLGVLEVRP